MGIVEFVPPGEEDVAAVLEKIKPALAKGREQLGLHVVALVAPGLTALVPRVTV